MGNKKCGLSLRLLPLFVIVAMLSPSGRCDNSSGVSFDNRSLLALYSPVSSRPASPSARIDLSNILLADYFGNSDTAFANRSGRKTSDLLKKLMLIENLSVAGDYDKKMQESDLESSAKKEQSVDKILEYRVVSGDSLWLLSRRYGVSMEKLVRLNELEDLELRIGQTLTIPVNTQKAIDIPADMRQETQLSESGYHWPANSRRITSPFGYRRHPLLNTRHFHNGVDIAGERGSPVYAAADGLVTFSGWSNYAGNMVIMKHFDGLTTTYAHLHRLYVKSGESVSSGQQIGEIGRTGRATGYHLHFGTRKYGAWSDPMDLFKSGKVAQKR